MSTETAAKPTVIEALALVMADVQAIRKRDRNKEQSYMFRGIDAVVNAVGPRLREHGVLVVPNLEESAWRDVRTSRDKPARECTVKVRYRFYGPAGDHIDAVVPGESMDFGDKGAAKAMSVAYRIALLQALCIPTDEPEPDAHTYDRAVEPPPRPDREQIIAKAEVAIASADTEEQVTALGLRVSERESEGAITADDAIALRRQIVARLDELHPAGERAAIAAVSTEQHRHMHALWRAVGLSAPDQREARLTRTALVVGRDVESSKDLSAAEADAVIAALTADVQTRKEAS